MTRRESGIAAVILALLACGVALLLWGLRLDDDAGRLGPLRSFTLQGQPALAVFHGGQLHLLDAQGRRFARQPYADLRLTDEPNDMDITAGADGQLQAWFFEDTLPRIVRCDFARERQRFERCAQVLQGERLKVNARSRAVHMAVDAARQRVFVADAKGHAVRVLGFDGRTIAQSEPGLLYFPNRLRLAGDTLMVADNDHRRLVWLDAAGDTPTLKLTGALHPAAHPQAGAGRTKVTDFAFRGAAGDPSSLWVLGVAQGQKNGQVLAYQGPGPQPVARASLGGHADPLWIDTLGDAAIVGDFDGVALLRVSARGEFLGEFGEPAFRRELADARASVGRSSGVTRAAWALLAGTMVLGFFLAWRYGERPGAREAAQAFAALEAAQPQSRAQPVVLAPLPWFRRQLTLVTVLMLVLTAVPFGVVLWFFGAELAPLLQRLSASPRNLVLLAGVIGAVGVATLLGVRLGQRRIVVEAGRLAIRMGRREQASAPLQELWLSPTALLAGRTMLPYRAAGALGRPGRWIYDEAQITQFVLAHVPPAQRVGAQELARVNLRRTPKWQMALVGAALLAYAAFEFWRVFR